MKTPAYLLATMAAAALAETSALSEGRHAAGRRKPKVVDKRKRAKRRRAKASRKRNRP